LFWQINDTYPVASWASLDYGGQWKPLHYMAKRFFLPVNVVAIPDTESRDLILKAINDTAARTGISLEVQAVSMGGGSRVVFTGNSRVGPDAAVEVGRVKLDDLDADEFLFFSWRDKSGALLGENDYFPQPYKAYEIPRAKVSAKWESGTAGPVLVLRSDKPAVFVTAGTDVPGYFSDNAVTLLPGRETRLSFTPRFGAKVNQKALASGLTVRHLRDAF
jgi:beta-mannosidase